MIQKSFVKKYVLIRKGWLKKEGCSGKDGRSSKKKCTKLFLNKKRLCSVQNRWEFKVK